MMDPSSGDFRGTERFSIQRRLGEGAFGVVYQAYDRERNVLVALKTLHRREPEALYRFKREFRTLVDLSHPNLVTLYELMSEAEEWFFTMELVQGQNFVEYVRGSAWKKSGSWSTAEMNEDRPDGSSTLSAPERPLYLDRLEPALRQLAEGICALHKAGKLHRDIKPSNVLVTSQGRVVLLDFGLVTELSPGISQSRNIVGTPIYMSPEQGSEMPVSEASDWYCVGVMLYEALTGRPPFTGKFLEVLISKQKKEPPPPKELVADIPENLNSLCESLLRRDPPLRPSGEEVLQRLGARHGERSGAVAHRPMTGLIGRDRHLAELWQAFRLAKDGQGSTVCVSGSSGTGKTALLRRFLEELHQQAPEAVILAGRCYERESVPYKALDSIVDALSQYLKRLSQLEAEAVMPLDAPALARLFPVLRQVETIVTARRALEIPDAQEWRRRAFAALRELLARLAYKKPLVLFIDDLQWGDVDSAALLGELLRPPDAPTLLLLVCYRREDVSTSPVLQALLPSLSAGENYRELPIAELRPEEASNLAIALLGEEYTPSVAQAIARESAGNPFFIDELARYAKEVSRPSGDRTGIATLEQVIEARISQLPDEARRLLEIVALAGRPLGRKVAKQAATLDSEEQAAWTVLRAGHWIRTTRTGDRDEFEIYHDRIREMVVAHLSTETLTAHHRRLAVALEASKADPEALAVHFLGGGDDESAARYAAVAAARASEALAFDRAARLYRLALHLQQGGSIERRNLQVKLGDALANAGRGAEASAEYLAAAQPVAGATQQLTPTPLELQRRAAEQLLHSGHIDEGLDLLRAVLKTMGWKLAETPRRALLSLLVRRALIHLRGLHFHERDVSQVSHEELTRVDTCWSVAASLGIIDTIRGADFQTRHLLLALRAGEPYRVARAFAIETAYTSTGGGHSWNRIQKIRQMTSELANRIQHPHALGVSALSAGMAAVLCGRWKEGRHLTIQAEEILRERCTGVAWEICIAQFYSLLCFYYQGELAEMSRRLPNLVKEAQERGDLWGVTNLQIRIAFLTRLMEDEPEKAEEELQRVMARWSQQGFHIQHWWALMAHLQIALYSGNGRRAWDLVTEQWPALVRSLRLKTQYVRIMSLQFRACSAVAVAADDPQRDTFLRTAERDVARMEKEKMDWASALALLIRGGIASIRQDTARAAALLSSAESAFETMNMAFHAAIARRRRGQILGADQGRALVESADQWMAGQRIRNPQRMANILAPGIW